MNKDVDPSLVSNEMYTHARNAVNNSHEGHLGTIQNEPSNLQCITLPYTLIGAILTEDNQWVLFTTDNTHSEIGLFNDETCSYSKIINADCLNFNTNYLITGAARRTFDCSVKVYWDDGLNPTRVLDINNPPFVIERTLTGDCYIETPTDEVDCEQLRLAPLLDIPCVSLQKSPTSGTLPNGTYKVAIAYAINEIRITDYLITTNPISLWDHGNISGALELHISETDQDFDEIEVVLISNINGQISAKRLGIYSTRQGSISITSFDTTLPEIPISNIPLQTPAYEKSDGTFAVGPYLVRTGIYTKPDFNYQLQANNIVTKWVSTRFPADYYRKSGKYVGYLRDEVYTFFIRWVYNTGEKSASYHIPCNINGAPGGFTFSSGSTDDGGVFEREGYTQPFLSTERYPDDRPDIWGLLCGEQIKHHRFPDNTVDNHFDTGGNSIRVMGVKFQNIEHPVDNAGNPITSIVGYEILRGSREGNKSIIAKGMVKNMRTYSMPGSGQQGLFQNYPYNDLRSRNTILYKTNSIATNTSVVESDGYIRNSTDDFYRADIVSFHSPDTTFTHPYLPGNMNLAVYEDIMGESKGYFERPHKHPEFKILGPGAEIISELVSAISTITTTLAGALGFDMKLTGTEDLPFQYPLTVNPSIPADTFGAVTVNTSPATWIMTGILISSNAVVLGATAAMRYAITREQMLKIFTALVAPQQFAKQYNSHGYYNRYRIGYQNRTVTDASYVKSSIQSFGNYRINNVFRNDYVVLSLNSGLTAPFEQDNSRFTKGDVGCGDPDLVEYTRNISSQYGAVKVNNPGQYGQLESIRQLPITTCVQKTNTTPLAKFASGVMFGGDTYIHRYTEKNPFLFFNDWLLGQPSDYTYNYRGSFNLPRILYWVDNRKVYTDFLKNVSDYRQLECEDFTGKSGDGSYFSNDPSQSTEVEKNDADDKNLFKWSIKDHFKKVDDLLRLSVKRGYFYLFCNGVHDFFVESDVNVAYRDWEDDPSKRFYDPYGFGDLSLMFQSDNIKSPGFYKYDYSLSVSKFYDNFISWGSLLPRSFDPAVAESCYSYYPRRVIYSLPQTEELKKDNWRSFLVNNYKDFSSKVTAIKSIGKTGAIILLERESPIQFMGVDTLETDGGTKITVGDGGLFNQALQNIVNSDRSYQYGSCQNRFAITSTPHGVFWVSQDQGKVFKFSGGIEEISSFGLKWWFAKYLPCQLSKHFPGYQNIDNTVSGAGVSMVYDSTNEVLYISKRDYKPKINNIVLAGNGFAAVMGEGDSLSLVPIQLCNTAYFEDISWTVSFDLKTNTWISYHDWHPDFTLPAKNHFITAKKTCSSSQSKLWKHGMRCDSYCNFYGTQYPFEVEFVSNTGATVTTMRNIEYMLECYRYRDNCQDKSHVLDFNFDQALVYNTEQVSGLLKLTLKNKSNPLDNLKYPVITPNYIEIPYAKEEHKYRFNLFFDITKDRGEFTSTQNSMFNASDNGYTYPINPTYVDYTKSQNQHKKFRHTYNKVKLAKVNSGNTKMIFKLNSTKVQPSLR